MGLFMNNIRRGEGVSKDKGFTAYTLGEDITL